MDIAPSSPPNTEPTVRPHSHGRIVGGLSLIAIGMFVFAIFILPPLYDVFCEITGLNGKADTLARQAISPNQPMNDLSQAPSITDNTTPNFAAYTAVESAESSSENNTTNNSSAALPVTIQFLADAHKDMPWEFKPMVFSMKIKPGKRHQTTFWVKNRSGDEMTGQAIPSVSPGHMAQYLKKIECFCFTQQTLAGFEEKEMPLSFYLSEDAPSDVSTLTLSYMLYNMSNTDEKSGRQPNNPGS